uniref:hypothetical protein n=1 Tax=Cellvibrio fontiphilus TaxID=1815559 RepID=UPI002B4BC3B3|nr:hypothetical protein [Cellvibrio fontiphilus]
MKNVYLKSLFSFLFVSACGAFLYFYLQGDYTAQNKIEITKKIDSVDKSLIVSSESTAKTAIEAQAQLQPTMLKDGYVLISPSELAQLEDWLTSKGYFPETDVDIYDSYSEDSLKELAKNGDLIAMNVLSTRFVGLGNEKEATFYMGLSVIYGSTVALDNLTIYTAPRPPYDNTEQERRPAVIETLAVIDVIAKRGDIALSRVSHDSFLNSYKRLYGTELKLNEEEIQIIRKRSQAIYDMYNQVRIENGLGEFDNIEPEGAKKFFGVQ